MESIEKKVADAILERKSDKIVLEDREYTICSPTPATLILVSELVSCLPVVNRNTDNVLTEVLFKAKDMKLIGRIAAVLILGAKRVKEERKIVISKEWKWSWKKFRYTTVSKEVSEVEHLSDLILENVSSATLLRIVSKRLGLMQIGDFFELTTSLSEANLLKETKEVVATASGE